MYQGSVKRFFEEGISLRRQQYQQIEDGVLRNDRLAPQSVLELFMYSLGMLPADILLDNKDILEVSKHFSRHTTASLEGFVLSILYSYVNQGENNFARRMDVIFNYAAKIVPTIRKERGREFIFSSPKGLSLSEDRVALIKFMRLIEYHSFAKGMSNKYCLANNMLSSLFNMFCRRRKKIWCPSKQESPFSTRMAIRST